MEWDRELLTRFREGDPRALAEVYRRHLGALTGMLRAAAYRGPGFAALQSAVELENTVLEVFARAFEPRARLVYDGIRPYEHFLMGIARNYLLELSRCRERVAGLDPTGDEGQQAIDASVDVHELIEDREVEELLRNFRATLTAGDGELFELRFAKGLAQDAASRELGLTRIQLRRRELSVKKRLLVFLNAHGYLRGLSSSGWSFSRQKVGS
ncbi:MAG: RNA polymerase sigma factor [Myxococcaceae bacterium]